MCVYACMWLGWGVGSSLKKKRSERVGKKHVVGAPDEYGETRKKKKKKTTKIWQRRS